jgi:hypothetical protein
METALSPKKHKHDTHFGATGWDVESSLMFGMHWHPTPVGPTVDAPYEIDHQHLLRIDTYARTFGYRS